MPGIKREATNQAPAPLEAYEQLAKRQKMNFEQLHTYFVKGFLEIAEKMTDSKISDCLKLLVRKNRLAEDDTFFFALSAVFMRALVVESSAIFPKILDCRTPCHYNVVHRFALYCELCLTKVHRVLV
ncbi:uncharacterized protein JN550_012644 [Neoarthrinium moseri]|uniref:uncharacterized protein n=1 Tax=Neoarthrinium moseri TaxID=1658444 RepID=UPI001FDC98CD|nr:uncharacterized protein JN550_012644 [Neoarthrinium moseri]KAI1858434.1 hypothetical protein JN550_012644 [Neoarthrinium moseri]